MLKAMNGLRAFGALILLAGISTPSFAELNPGSVEFSLNIPYIQEQDFEFDGDASANIEDSFGIGVGLAYNFSDRLALRSDVFWNNSDYTGERILDDVGQSIERVKGEIENTNLSFGADFYFTTAAISPFISANFGWSFIDTNIPEGPASSACWWDPWWGYICGEFQNTHDETSFFYGAGAGIRFDLSRSTFIKAGYYNQWLDFNESSGKPQIDMFRIDFGVSY